MDGVSSAPDLFICHASEDKKRVARPLAQALIDRGLTVWLDELELTLGDSLNRRIDAALARSRFGVVVLSPAFFAKEWPQRELAGLAAREVDARSKVILPVWHEIDHNYLVRHAPMLADRLGAPTSAGLDNVAEKIALALERVQADTPAGQSEESIRPRDFPPHPTGISRRTPPWLMGIVALSLLPTGLAGFVIARSKQGETPIPLKANASNRAIEVSFPAGWRRSLTSPPTPGIKLREPLTLTSSSSTGALILGSTETTSTTLLPTSLISVLQHLPRVEVVRLADKTFYRYRNVMPKGATRSETVYVQPTTGGVMLGLCMRSPASLAAVGADCERILGSLKLISTKPLQLGPSSVYAAALTSAISELNSSRAGASAHLTHATTATSQADAAERLAQEYERSADSLQHVIPGPPERAANTAVVRALKRVAGGYTAMATGAREQKTAEFSKGREAVAAGLAALASVFVQLTKLGFRFGG